MSYRLSEIADADLLAILVEGVERFGFNHAVSYHRSLEQVFERLADFPKWRVCVKRLFRRFAPIPTDLSSSSTTSSRVEMC